MTHKYPDNTRHLPNAGWILGQRWTSIDTSFGECIMFAYDRTSSNTFEYLLLALSVHVILSILSLIAHFIFFLICYHCINASPAKLSYLNFHPFEIVSRYRDSQFQVGENYSYLFNLRLKHLKILLFKHASCSQ